VGGEQCAEKPHLAVFRASTNSVRVLPRSQEIWWVSCFLVVLRYATKSGTLTNNDSKLRNFGGVSMINGWRPALLGILGMAIYMIAGSVLGTPNAAIAITTTAQWVIVPEQSRVLIDYERDGQWAEGEFARFEGTGAFDPGAPNYASLNLGRFRKRPI
jgi:hypothetical protein